MFKFILIVTIFGVMLFSAACGNTRLEKMASTDVEWEQITDRPDGAKCWMVPKHWGGGISCQE